MLAYFTLGMMVGILIIQAAITRMMMRIADNNIKTHELVNATLKKQNEIQLELIRRVTALERKMNASLLGAPTRGRLSGRTGLDDQAGSGLM